MSVARDYPNSALRFLLLNQTFYPDVASTAQHLADLAVELAARGHSVTVVASRHAYDDPLKRFSKKETWRGVRIIRVGSTGFGKSSKICRVLDFATFLLFCGLRVSFLRRHDVVVALTSPPLISVIGLGLAHARASRFVYWVMDLNPDEALAAGWLQPKSVTTILLEKLSRLTLRRADQVIVLDRFMHSRILAKGAAPARTSVLSPWSHDSEVQFDALGRDQFRRRHGLEGKFVVMYSGNHGPCHPLDTVVQAARRLACRPDLAFCFIGGGSEFRAIQRALEPCCSRQPPGDCHARPRNILFLPYQPLSRLSASLSAADLHLVVMGDPFVGLVHPCKIYNILRIGGPVVYVGPTPSAASELLAQAAGQLLCTCIKHGDVPGLILAIEHLRSRSIGRPRPPQLPISAAFSKQTVLPRLINQLEGQHALG